MRALVPEPAFPIRLIALDIDGTIVGDDLTLGPRIARARCALALQRGVRVSLVTGRMATSAQKYAEVLGLVDPIVAYQGALIRAMPEPARGTRGPGTTGRGTGGPATSRPALGRLLLHRPLPVEAARRAVAWSLANGLDPHVNHLESFVIRADDPRIDDYSAFLGAPASRVPDIVRAISRPVTKVLAAAEPPLPMDALLAARSALDGSADVTVSHPRFLEFVAPGVSKGGAVRWLGRRHGIPMGHALAIGDQCNDLEMILAVGHGAVMPSAPAAVREAARYLPGPIDAEGAAELIEALVLARPDAARRNAATLARRAASLRQHDDG